MVTKTIGRLHFDDLDPIRFEELCLSIIYRMRRWNSLDHLGKLGSDGGVDIRACEQLENGKKNIHHFQCKRYSRLTKTDMKKIIADYVAKNDFKADYYYLIIGCNLSREHNDFFRTMCSDKGLKNVEIWTASILETILFTNYHDLLFAFFGVNMTDKRNTRIASVRRNIDLKHKMHNEFLKELKNLTNEERQQLLKHPQKKFIHSKVLIRSIYDTQYPDNTTLNGDYSTGYFRAAVFDFYHNGLQVYAFPYGIRAKIKVKKQENDTEIDTTEEMQLQVIGCIPFENIIAYDIDGDEYYPFPHLFCDYPNGTDPFDEIIYLTDMRIPIDKENIIEEI